MFGNQKEEKDSKEDNYYDEQSLEFAQQINDLIEYTFNLVLGDIVSAAEAQNDNQSETNARQQIIRLNQIARDINNRSRPAEEIIPEAISVLQNITTQVENYMRTHANPLEPNMNRWADFLEREPILPAGREEKAPIRRRVAFHWGDIDSSIEGVRAELDTLETEINAHFSRPEEETARQFQR